MIEDGDRVMVCLSGGKDSYTLLDILLSLQRSAPVQLRTRRRQPRPEAAGLPGARAARVPDRARRAVPRDRAGHVPRRQARDPGRPHDVQPLLAAAPRRALPLRERARHHQGRARPSPRRHRRDAVPEHVLRRASQDDAAEAAVRRRPAHRDPSARLRAGARHRALLRARVQFPIIPCNLCGSQEHLQRVAIKRMLAGWEREYPGRTEAIFSALRNVRVSHLADPRAFEFAALEAQRLSGRRAEVRASPGKNRARRRLTAAGGCGGSRTGSRSRSRPRSSRAAGSRCRAAARTPSRNRPPRRRRR